MLDGLHHLALRRPRSHGSTAETLATATTDLTISPSVAAPNPASTIAPIKLATRPPGPSEEPQPHFYSPIPNVYEVRADANRIFDWNVELKGIDLNEGAQRSLLGQLLRYYPQQPFEREKQPDKRYFFDNSYFSFCDGLFLHCMIRHHSPRRIVEVGAGFSTGCMLDTLDTCGASDTSVVCIEPFPDRLESVLWPDDLERITLIPSRVQDVDDRYFDELQSDDILFIDSSHIAKVGSDVNHIIFHILPRLKKGVYVHFHDLFYPFEYPEEWIMKGRAWNECYMLRAFLAFNSKFQIALFNSFLTWKYRQWFQLHMPLCLENTGGSIWLRRTAR